MMTPEKSTFDLDIITSEPTRRHYSNVLARTEDAAASLIGAYRKEEEGYTISSRYLYSVYFNASVYEKRKNEFNIDLHSPVLVLLLVLFGKLFSYRYVFPEVEDEDAEDVYVAHVPFVMDLRAARLDTTWWIGLGDKRDKLAMHMADFCVTFIVMHELGHVICGHVPSARFHFGDDGISEFFDLSTLTRRSLRARRSWEHDADAVASQLSVQYIEQLVDHALTDAFMSSVFGVDNSREKSIERLVAMVVVALFAMFVYMGASARATEKSSSHPAPLARSLYIKDMILKAAEGRWKVDLDRVFDYQTEYLDQMISALIDVGIIGEKYVEDGLIERAEQQASELRRSSGKYRAMCERWAWLPLDEWG